MIVYKKVIISIIDNTITKMNSVSNTTDKQISMRAFGYKMSNPNNMRELAITEAIKHYGLFNVTKHMTFLESIHKGGKYNDVINHDVNFVCNQFEKEDENEVENKNLKNVKNILTDQYYSDYSDDSDDSGDSDYLDDSEDEDYLDDSEDEDYVPTPTESNDKKIESEIKSDLVFKQIDLMISALKLAIDYKDAENLKRMTTYITDLAKTI